MIMWRATGSKAFTLLEALMASVLLTLVVSAALLPFTLGIKTDRIVGSRAEAVALGQGLMEEILAKPFYDPSSPDDMTPGPDSNESGRTTFDNVDDYHGYLEKPGMVVPTFLDGIAADNAAATIDADLSRQATVEYVWLEGQDPSNPPNVCRVNVTVYAGATAVIRLSRLVYGNAQGD